MQHQQDSLDFTQHDFPRNSMAGKLAIFHKEERKIRQHTPSHEYKNCIPQRQLDHHKPEATKVDNVQNYIDIAIKERLGQTEEQLPLYVSMAKTKYLTFIQENANIITKKGSFERIRLLEQLANVYVNLTKIVLDKIRATLSVNQTKEYNDDRIAAELFGEAKHRAMIILNTSDEKPVMYVDEPNTNLVKQIVMPDTGRKKRQFDLRKVGAYDPDFDDRLKLNNDYVGFQNREFDYSRRINGEARYY